MYLKQLHPLEPFISFYGPKKVAKNYFLHSKSLIQNGIVWICILVSKKLSPPKTDFWSRNFAEGRGGRGVVVI